MKEDLFIVEKFAKYIVRYSFLTMRWAVFNNVIYKQSFEKRSDAVKYAKSESGMEEPDETLMIEIDAVSIDSVPSKEISDVPNLNSGGIGGGGGGGGFMGGSFGGSSAMPSTPMPSGSAPEPPAATPEPPAAPAPSAAPTPAPEKPGAEITLT
jgi:hypothetical protein